MGGGGGSAFDPTLRSWSGEWPTIKQGYQGQTGQYNQFTQQDPLLGAAGPFALQGLQGVSQFTGPLSQMFKNLPNVSQFTGPLTRLFNRAGTSQDLINPLMRGYKQVGQRISGGGRLLPWEERDVGQASAQAAAAMGMGHTPGSLGTRLLNRGEYQRQRFNEALTQGQGLAGTIEGLRTSGPQRQLALASGITGLRGQDIAQRAGLASGVYGLRGQALQPVLSTAETGQKIFSGLTNPILNYIGQIFDFNANAQNAASIAGANKQAGTSSGIMSTIGSLASTIGPMLAMSDKTLKRKIKSTGAKTVEGVPIKTWEYKKAPGLRILGVVADDVLKKRPDAVVKIGKKLAVDYRRLLGAPFMEVQAT